MMAGASAGSSSPDSINSEDVGGYPLEVFRVSFDEKFKCNSCGRILRDPVQSYCGHRFCRSCISKLIRQYYYVLTSNNYIQYRVSLYALSLVLIAQIIYLRWIVRLLSVVLTVNLWYRNKMLMVLKLSQVYLSWSLVMELIKCKGTCIAPIKIVNRVLIENC